MTAVMHKGCMLVGSYILAIGVLSAILLIALYLLPALAGRTACVLVALRRVCSLLVLLMIPTFFVLNILAARWVHVDDCWDRIDMRRLAVIDAVVSYCVMFLATWYVFLTYVRDAPWWVARRQRWRLLRLGGFVQRNARVVLMLVVGSLVLGGVARLRTNHHGEETDTHTTRAHETLL